MGRDIVPRLDEDFRNWAREFEAGLRERAKEHGISKKQLDELSASIESYEQTVDRFLKAREELASAATEKEIKRSPLVRMLTAYAESTQWDPTSARRRRPAVEPVVETKEIVSEAMETDAPAIHLESGQGKVIVHFGGLPGWASGVCVYRRKKGESDWESLPFASKSPFVDEVSGSAAGYEYVARYWNSRDAKVGAKSEAVRVSK